MRSRQEHAVLVLSGIAAAALLCTACTSSSGGSGAAQTSGSTSTSVSSPPASSTTTALTPPPATTSTPATPSSSTSTSSTSTSSTAAAGRNPAWCVDGEITDGVSQTPGGGAAGHNSVVLTFTNSSTRTCVLYGYPGADALNSSGHVVAHATRSLTGYIGGSYGGLKSITLHPGQVASTILEGDVGDGGPDCTAGSSLVVTAPNLFHSSPLPGAPYVCMFLIHPVVAGSTGRA